MKYFIATLGSVAAFSLAFFVAGAIGWWIAMLVWVSKEERPPAIYWSLMLILVVLLSVTTAIVAFRGTLRRHQKMGSESI